MTEPLFVPGARPPDVRPLSVAEIIAAHPGMGGPPVQQTAQAVGEPFAAISFEPDPVAPPTPAQASKPGLASDTGNLLMSGFDQLASQLRWATGKVFGDKAVKFIDDLGGTSQEKMDATAKARTDALSPEMRSALGKEFVTEKDGKYGIGDAWSDPRSYYGMVVQSIPGTLVTMGPAASLARSVATRTLEKSLAAGMAREAAEHAAGIAAQRAALISGGLLEGAQSAAQSGQQVEDQIKALPIEVLRTSQAFTELAGKVGEEKARTQLASDRSARAALFAGVTTAAFGGQGDLMLQKIIRGEISGGVLKKIGKSMLAEGLFEEAPQSALQQMSENEAMRAADPRVTLMQGVANQAVAGGVAGAIMGAGFGGIGALADKPKGLTERAAEAAGVAPPSNASIVSGQQYPALPAPPVNPQLGYEPVAESMNNERAMIGNEPAPPQLPAPLVNPQLPYDPRLDTRDMPTGTIAVDSQGQAGPQFRSEVPPQPNSIDRVPVDMPVAQVEQPARAPQAAIVPRALEPSSQTSQNALPNNELQPTGAQTVENVPRNLPVEEQPTEPPKSTFISELSKAGGVLIDIAADVTGDRKTANKASPGLFKGAAKGGMDADALVHWAAQAGYITHAEAEDTVDAFKKVSEMIRDAIERKVPIYRVGEHEGVGVAAKQQERALAGIDLAAQRQQANEQEALAERDAIQHEDEALAHDGADAFAEAQLDRIFARDDEATTLRKFGEEPNAQPAAEVVHPSPEGAAQAAPAEGAGASEATQAPAEESRPGLDLTAETPEQVRARATEAERAAEQQRQRENAPPPEDFQLAASERPADQADARGQTGLFDSTPPVNKTAPESESVSSNLQGGSEPAGSHKPGGEGATPSPATNTVQGGRQAEGTKMEAGPDIAQSESATLSADRESEPAKKQIDLQGFTVEVPAADAETGAKGTVEENAAAALKRVDSQLEKAKALLACLRH